MKRYLSKWGGIIAILCMGIFMILMPSSADAEYYTIQSLYQNIHGYAEYFGGYDSYNHIEYLPSYDSFSDTSGISPVSLSDRAEVYGGENDVYGVALAWANLSSSFDGTGFEAYIMLADAEAMGNAEASITASIDLIFTPTTNAIWHFITDEYGFNKDSFISITDLNNENIVYFGRWENRPYVVDDVALYVTHTYELNMTINEHGFLWDYEAHQPFQSINATMTPIPEPATMLLIGFGLMGLAGVRRKFQN